VVKEELIEEEMKDQESKDLIKEGTKEMINLEVIEDHLWDVKDVEVPWKR